MKPETRRGASKTTRSDGSSTSAPETPSPVKRDGPDRSPEAGYEQRLREIRAIADRCAELMGPGPSAVEHGDLLYDDKGLPR